MKNNQGTLIKIFIGLLAFAAVYFLFLKKDTPPPLPPVTSKVVSPVAPVTTKAGSGIPAASGAPKASPIPMPSGAATPVSLADEKYRQHLTEIANQETLEKSRNDSRVPKEIYAEFKTTLGSFTAKMDLNNAPKTVANFVGLAEGTVKSRSFESAAMIYRKFYDGNLIHRVVHGYFFQAGALRNGKGEPGFYIQDEFNTRPADIEPGMLIMAHAGKGTAGSQFYITLSDMRGVAENNNTVFGKIVKGMDVVKKIGEIKTDVFDKPLQEIKIIEVKIQRVYGKAQPVSNVTVLVPSSEPAVAPQTQPAQSATPQQTPITTPVAPPPTSQEPSPAA